MFTILKDQFERFRDGDRFWYKNGAELIGLWTILDTDLEHTRLPDILLRNTAIHEGKISANIFFVVPAPTAFAAGVALLVICAVRTIL